VVGKKSAAVQGDMVVDIRISRIQLMWLQPMSQALLRYTMIR
jgi:hypothetical protein